MYADFSRATTPSTAPPEFFSTELWPGDGVPTFYGKKSTAKLHVKPDRRSTVINEIKLSPSREIVAKDHLIIIRKPQRILWPANKKATAVCFSSQHHLSREAYYQKGTPVSLSGAGDKSTFYLCYRAEGMHLIAVDGRICQISEGALGTAKHNSIFEWWIKTDANGSTSGWLLVGEDVKEGKRKF
jgi:hypothetical protein